MLSILFRVLLNPHFFFQGISSPLAQKFGLTTLAAHFDAVLYSYLFFTTTQHLIVPVICQRLFPQSYGSLKGNGARNKWHVRGVSMAHVLIILPLATRCLSVQRLEDNRAFGWDDRVGTVLAIGLGYFIWDTIDSILNFQSIGFVLHGISCFFIYLLSFRPFVAYYALRCLLWETSTIFLNIHWILDKTGQTGSRKQIVNGILLLASFIFTRIIWGGLISYRFFITLFEVRDQIPQFVFFIYGVGNILLQGLNYYWFLALLRGLTSRLNKAEKKK